MPSYHREMCMYFYVSYNKFITTGVNSSPGQHGHHFTDNIFKCIFINEKLCILIWIPLNFVPMGPIDNESTSVQVMAWRRTGDKPLPEPMLIHFVDVALEGEELNLINIWQLHVNTSPTWTTSQSSIQCSFSITQWCQWCYKPIRSFILIR